MQYAKTDNVTEPVIRKTPKQNSIKSPILQTPLKNTKPIKIYRHQQ